VTAVILALLVIIVITLHPYEFSLKGIPLELDRQFLVLGWGKSDEFDVLVNVFLFVPLGFNLARYLIGRKKWNRRTALILILLISLGLSYAVEVLQLFMASRFPSLVDVIANSIGGVFGGICFHSIHDSEDTEDCSIHLKRDGRYGCHLAERSCSHCFPLKSLRVRAQKLRRQDVSS
jgi:glycopeptide antibiotics resistance protein